MTRLDAVEQTLQQLRLEVLRRVRSEGIPGAALVIADREGIAWGAALGEADSESKARVTLDTLFGLQSLSLIHI